MTNEKSSNIFLAIALTACQTSAVQAPVPPAAQQAELTLKELVVVCADQKCGQFLDTASGTYREMEFLRQVAGSSGMNEAKWVALRDSAAARGVEYADINLVAHVSQQGVGCGGLKACGAILDGNVVSPPELDNWARTFLIQPDPYLGLEEQADAVRTVFPKARINRWVLVNETQMLIPVATDTAGQPVKIFYTAQQWADVIGGKTIPIIRSGDFPAYPSIEALVRMNETVRPQAVETVRRLLATPHGQPFDELMLSGFTDSGLAARNAASFQITMIPGLEKDAVAQMSYGLANSNTGTRLRITVNGSRQLEETIIALNSSPNFRAMIANPEWNGLVNAEWFKPNQGLPEVQRVTLRYPGTMLKNGLYMPVTGGSVPAAMTQTMRLPTVVDEAVVADMMAKAGRPIEKTALKELTAKLLGYTGKTLLITLIALDVWVYSDIAYQIMAETGDVLFRYGPEWPVQTTAMGAYDPTVGDAALFQKIWENPYANMAATSIYWSDMTSIWLHIQEQAKKGQQPCIFLANSADSITPLPVVCSTTLVVEGDPQGMMFYGFDGQTMLVRFEDGNWVTDQSGAITWPIETLDPLYVCQGGAFVEGTPVVFSTRGKCYWNK